MPIKKLIFKSRYLNLSDYYPIRTANYYYRIHWILGYRIKYHHKMKIDLVIVEFVHEWLRNICITKQKQCEPYEGNEWMNVHSVMNVSLTNLWWVYHMLITYSYNCWCGNPTPKATIDNPAPWIRLLQNRQKQWFSFSYSLQIIFLTWKCSDSSTLYSDGEIRISPNLL